MQRAQDVELQLLTGLGGLDERNNFTAGKQNLLGHRIKDFATIHRKDYIAPLEADQLHSTLWARPVFGQDSATIWGHGSDFSAVDEGPTDDVRTASMMKKEEEVVEEDNGAPYQPPK